jgi:hypothetical protein
MRRNLELKVAKDAKVKISKISIEVRGPSVDVLLGGSRNPETSIQRDVDYRSATNPERSRNASHVGAKCYEQCWRDRHVSIAIYPFKPRQQCARPNNRRVDG